MSIKSFLAKRRLMRQAVAQVYDRLQAEQRRKEQLQQLAKTPLNYAIIQDLVNTCYWHGVVALVTLPDGSKIEVKRTDAFDREMSDRAGLAGGAF